ncbi:MAG: macro domain-containing protein [Peptoniphilaceae bacterium]|uniref:macro domain-containing protein n=1 Tax=Peptoniphilus sp. TaxID=1971214 RepID=UPI002975A325|nr:macro domain-containing protein [Peptoniphilus sp.]MDD7352602.1 macro domain-containing protein [Peptoniphilaceae bacterium]MDY3902362.1 macro domain-containing protein [Peptoniphilus sp.]
MSFQIEKKNILDYEVDAIVNAANKELKKGCGVCGQIFANAKDEELEKECNKLAPINPGESVITKGYNLKAKYIIHTVGPIYFDGNQNERKILEAAYKSALELAVEKNLESMVFPLLSSGIYGYPLDEAAEVAVFTIRGFLKNHDLDVSISVLNDNVLKVLKKKNKEWLEK